MNYHLSKLQISWRHLIIPYLALAVKYDISVFGGLREAMNLCSAKVPIGGFRFLSGIMAHMRHVTLTLRLASKLADLQVG